MPYQQRRLHRTNREMASTFGVIAAGTALFEAALIPGMVIGGAGSGYEGQPNIAPSAQPLQAQRSAECRTAQEPLGCNLRGKSAECANSAGD
jgi:hypothetical protein